MSQGSRAHAAVGGMNAKCGSHQHLEEGRPEGQLDVVLEFVAGTPAGGGPSGSVAVWPSGSTRLGPREGEAAR